MDTEIDLSEIDGRFWKLLSQFEPFGPHNTQPVFVSRNVKVSGAPSIVGKHGHLKLRITQDNAYEFDVIGFKMHHFKALIDQSADKRVDVAFVIDENQWFDKRTHTTRRELQLQLRDVKIC